MAEMRTPLEVAREFYNVEADASSPVIDLLAELIRQEREEAFSAGAAAMSAYERRPGDRDASARYIAARLAAVEGRKEGEGDAAD